MGSEAADQVACVDHRLLFAFSPISTSRRIASERETSLTSAQASRAATVAGSRRAGIVSLYFVPAGRPLDFLCTVFDCLAMIICVHEKSAGGKRSTSSPGSNPREDPRVSKARSPHCHHRVGNGRSCAAFDRERDGGTNRSDVCFAR